MPIVHGQPVAPDKLAFAKQLRRTMTRAERLLWSALRPSRLPGLHFRREQVIGRYIVDFYCEAARLAIEVDGSPHDLRGDYDDRRDAELQRAGVTTLHVPEQSVRREFDMIVGWIEEEARKRIAGDARRPNA